EPAWVLSRHESPPPPPERGLGLRWCTTRLAAQPLLAGLKHCNRLEQVLARLELRGGGDDEGLLLGEEGEVVSAISANLFILRGGRWWTPPVDRCGVAGVCRGWLLEQGLAGERRLDREAVEQAEAVVLTNAVRGILPVSGLGTRRWSPHPRTGALRAALAAAHPAFADS
ncbi:aminotransferase class IV, partial [Novilysobacter defluvii]